MIKASPQKIFRILKINFKPPFQKNNEKRLNLHKNEKKKQINPSTGIKK